MLVLLTMKNNFKLKNIASGCMMLVSSYYTKLRVLL